MTFDELKLIQIVDPNLLLIISNIFTINKNKKNYYRGQCIKAINNEIVDNYSQEEVNEVLMNTKIVIDKTVLTKENVSVTRSRNDEIRNKHVIVLSLTDKDDDASFHFISINYFIVKVCNVSWYNINFQRHLN